MVGGPDSRCFSANKFCPELIPIKPINNFSHESIELEVSFFPDERLTWHEFSATICFGNVRAFCVLQQCLET